MTVNHPTDPKPIDPELQQQGNVRKNRGVRFSDSEWEEVRDAAQTHGITPAEFVRQKILALVRNREDPAPVSLPAHLVPLIERTFRYTYMIATRMRADMVDHGEREQLEHLVEEARRLQDTLKDAPPE